MGIIQFKQKGRRFRIDGLEQTRKVFPQLSREASGRLTNAINQGAEEIKVTAQALAPVRTGELRDAIEVRASLKGFAATGAVGKLVVGTKNDNPRIERYIGVFPATKGSPGWYAAFVEFGTAARTAGKRYLTRAGRSKVGKASAIGAHHPGTDPQPFLFPAYRILRQRVWGRIKRELKRGFKEVAARNFKRAA